MPMIFLIVMDSSSPLLWSSRHPIISIRDVHFCDSLALSANNAIKAKE